MFGDDIPAADVGSVGGLPMKLLRFATALGILAIGSSSVWAKSRMEWGTTFDESIAGLYYAEPESDEGDLWISCDAKTGVIDIYPPATIKGLKAGEKGSIVLSSPGGSATIEGVVFLSELYETLQISGPPKSADDLIAVFRGSGRLHIAVPGKRYSIPLNGQARKAFAVFRQQCSSLK
ncbi:hypothetical protein [Microvirga alba]|uniref:Invasion associated locus B family protein n=1 Tax=Microvirga alba TaxID=2791025 RepID=A0A931BLC2_9HYPH|nr:hypothetical protein [Microvirga alba]MBF9233021.1 hypothetical protein [Microvirga alba]